MLALSKILTKYDKVRWLENIYFYFIVFCIRLVFISENVFYQITSRDAAKSYMKMVDKSCLGSSDEVS